MNKALHQFEGEATGAPGTKPQVVILGAGPAGIGAALMLVQAGKADPIVLERQDAVGGNAGSFPLEGVQCDFGSHRLHPASEPHILKLVKDAVGEDLLWRPRHGRILLKKSWIHFPLKPMDLLLKLPKGFTFALMRDAALAPIRKQQPAEDTFAGVLRQGLGPAMSDSFYFPYVRKLWNLPPEELAVTLAKRRVSGSSAGKIIAKILRQLPGIKKKTAGSFGGFYYPKKGFGQICDDLKSEAEKNGARFELGAAVTAVEHEGGKVKAVRWTKDGVEHRREAGAVWSSVPINALLKLMDPPPPPELQEAATRIRYRGMILIYLVLEQQQFTEYDAHYFPELSVPISRLSEPKNYSDTLEPRGSTVLCAELPCNPDEPLWSLSDDELGRKLCGWLGDVGLPVTAKVRRTVTRRLAQAYPVYDRGFEKTLSVMETWIGGVEGLLTYGRQGLFAHDNTHHALAMAHAAVDCLRPDGSFDEAAWAVHRIGFEKHVVED